MMRIGVAIEKQYNDNRAFLPATTSTFYLRFGSGDHAQEVALTEEEAFTLNYMLCGCLPPEGQREADFYSAKS